MAERERGEVATGGWHEELEAVGDALGHILGVGLRRTEGDAELLADLHRFLDRRGDVGGVLPSTAERDGKIAFADQHQAALRHLFENAAKVTDALLSLALEAQENLPLGV